MSTFEYHDLFLLSQETGKYHVFTFDIVESKKMPSKVREEAQHKLIKLMMSIYKLIEEIQEKTGKQILVFDDDFVTYDNTLPLNGFGMKREPFLIGDTFGFTIYRDSLDNDTILGIYRYFKDSLGIEFDLHISDGFYETNDYGEANTKYFRGYCIDLLSNYHKVQTIDSINKLIKKLQLPKDN